MTSEVVTLKSLAHVITKGTTPTKAQGYTDNGINFIRALSIDKNGQLDEGTFLKISDETNANLKRSIVQEGDVLFTIAGVIGRVTVVEKKHLPANLNQALAIIRPKKDKISSRYLANLLRSHEAQFYLKSRVVESVQANLSLFELGRFPIEEISLELQNNRNKMLELIEDKNIINSKCSDVLGTSISFLFRSWFINFDPVKAKAEGNLPYGMDEETSALFSDSFEDSELGPIPAGWRVGTISEFGKIVTGRTPSSKNPEHFDGPIPFITIPDLARNIWQEETERTISQAGSESLKSAVIPANSVCVSCIATVGNVGITTRPSITNQQIHSIICDKGYSSQFVYSLMTSFVPNLKFFAGGGAVVQNISKSMFGKQRVIIPPLDIVEKFTEITRNFSQNIRAAKSTSRNLNETREALLPRLMSGELKVN